MKDYLLPPKKRFKEVSLTDVCDSEGASPNDTVSNHGHVEDNTAIDPYIGEKETCKKAGTEEPQSEELSCSVSAFMVNPTLTASPMVVSHSLDTIEWTASVCWSLTQTARLMLDTTERLAAGVFGAECLMETAAGNRHAVSNFSTTQLNRGYCSGSIVGPDTEKPSSGCRMLPHFAIYGEGQNSGEFLGYPETYPPSLTDACLPIAQYPTTINCRGENHSSGSPSFAESAKANELASPTFASLYPFPAYDGPPHATAEAFSPVNIFAGFAPPLFSEPGFISEGSAVPLMGAPACVSNEPPLAGPIRVAGPEQPDSTNKT